MKIINRIFIGITVLFIVIMLALPFGAHYFDANLVIEENVKPTFFFNKYKTLIVISLAIFFLIILSGRLIYLYFFSKEELKELSQEFRFITKEATNAWILGGAVSSIVLLLYFLSLTDKSFKYYHDHFITIYTILYTIIASALVLNSFYKRLAPILSVDRLLREITRDLKEVTDKKKQNNSVWLVYPALNIGELSRKPEFPRFKVALQNFSMPENNSLNVITIPKNKYDALFIAYTRQNNVKHSARQMLDGVLPYGTEHCEIDLNEFPPQVLLINDIVYTIQSYGMPYYDGNKFHSSIKAKDEFLSILAYRKKDAALRKTILNDLKNHPKVTIINH